VQDRHELLSSFLHHRVLLTLSNAMILQVYPEEQGVRHQSSPQDQAAFGKHNPV
jgi:hypothetical protein